MSLETQNDEEARLAALHRHKVDDAHIAVALDNLVSLAVSALEAPIAAISILDRTTQHFLAVRGMNSDARPREGTLAETVLDRGDPVVIEEGSAALQPDGVKAYLGLPLFSADGYCLGVLEIMDPETRRFTEAEITVATDLARLAMNCLTIGQAEDYDTLTGAVTRRRFQNEIGREFVRARRYDRPATLVFLDVDRFAEINAELGLGVGDQIIRAVANRAMELLRTSDVFGRIGGEAFGLLLPETLAYEASQCAERLREEISRLRFRNEKGVFSVTASFGVAPLKPPIASAIEWFAQADIALYGAKQLGRDCVAFAPDLPEKQTPATKDAAEKPPARPLH